MRIYLNGVIFCQWYALKLGGPTLLLLLPHEETGLWIINSGLLFIPWVRADLFVQSACTMPHSRIRHPPDVQ